MIIIQETGNIRFVQANFCSFFLSHVHGNSGHTRHESICCQGNKVVLTYSNIMCVSTSEAHICEVIDTPQEKVGSHDIKS